MTRSTNKIFRNLFNFSNTVSSTLNSLVNTMFFTTMFSSSHAAFEIRISVSVEGTRSLEIRRPLRGRTVLRQVRLNGTRKVNSRNTYNQAATQPRRGTIILNPLGMINSRRRMSTRLRLTSRTTFMINLLRCIRQQITIMALLRAFLSFFGRRKNLVPTFKTKRFQRRHTIFIIIRRRITTFNSGRHVITNIQIILRRFTRLFNNFSMMTNTIRLRSIQVIGAKAKISTRRNILYLNVFNICMIKVINNRR